MAARGWMWPWPRRSARSPGRSRAVCSIASRISSGSAPGHLALMCAATALTIGAAMEVPLAYVIWLPGAVERIVSPGATTTPPP